MPGPTCPDYRRVLKRGARYNDVEDGHIVKCPVCRWPLHPVCTPAGPVFVCNCPRHTKAAAMGNGVAASGGPTTQYLVLSTGYAVLIPSCSEALP
jgi:hypothetical protein